MRHRASRPLLDLWHRLPHAGARRLGELAKPGPIRALVALILVLSLGTAAYAVVASVVGGSSSREAESADRVQRLGPTTSRDGERPNLTHEIPTSDGRTPNGRDSDPGTSAAGQPEAPSPATEVPATPTPTLRSKLGRVTRSPSTRTASPSTSPPRPSATASTTPQDLTPPKTILSQVFPEGDAALFSFGANESASFTCSLDGAAYTSCASPTHYSDLDPGWHTFAVRATDADGNIDTSPAEVRWHATDGRSSDQ